MNIALKSDFRDYYDHWFLNAHFHNDYKLAFTRNMDQGLSRPLMFDFMSKELNLRVPQYGKISQLQSLIDPNEYVVLHENLRIHVGEGKKLIRFKQIASTDDFVVKYIDPSEENTSYRYLRIGKKHFWFKYTSENDWRSNVGDVVIKRIRNSMATLVNFDVVKHPLYAIDFVKDKNGKMYALDFNESPGLKGTGIEEILKPKEVYNLICEELI